MMQSYRRRSGVSAAIAGRIVRRGQLHILTSTTAKTRRRRCRCRSGTRRFPTAGCAIRLMLQTRTSDRTLKGATSFIRAGSTSAIEHDLSTEEERSTLPFFLETARPEKREWFAAAFFSVDGGDWCLPIFRGDDAVHARRRARLAEVGPYSRQNRQPGPKVRGVRHRVETLSAGASELRRGRHRCDRPRNPDEFACARSAWRGLQPRPGSSSGVRSRQQSPTAAAGFVCFACGTRRRSVLCANRRRSG